MLVSRENLFKKVSKIFPFNLSTPEKIRSLVEKSEVVFFEAGNFVYMEGASSTNFYVIYEGNVEILVEDHQILRKLNNLHDNDFFGEDVLNLKRERTSSARVLKDALLIRIPKKLLESFIKGKYEIAHAFSIISRTYSKLFDLKFRDLSKETVFYIGNPHQYAYLSKVALPMLIMSLPVFVVLVLSLNKVLSGALLIGVCVLLAILFLLQCLWHFYEWKNDYYVITGMRVINLTRNLFTYESKFEIPLTAINNLEIKMNIFGRNLDFGDLRIKTFTGETTLKSVPFVSEVQAYLEILMARNRSFIRLEERKSFEKIVNAGLTTSNEGQETIENRASEAGSPKEDNNGPFRMVYRTHWIILLKKVLFPSLLLISIALLLFFFSANKIKFFESTAGILLAGKLIYISILWWIYQFFDWRNDQYHITSNQIIDIYRKPFGTEDRRTASIQNIQSIRFERKGFLGLILNFGTVYIRVGDEEFTFDNVPDPASIQEKLFSVLEASINQKKISELTEQQQKLAEWIDAYHQIKEKKPGESDINN